MATLNQLSTATSLTSSDQIILYSTVNGSGRKASLNTLLEWIEANFASPEFSTQYASPNVNGFVVPVASTTSSTWLLLTPTTALSVGTIVLPAASQIADGTELLVYSSQDIASLAVSLNGATAVNGAPGFISANASFALRFDKLSNAWWAVQGQSSGTYAQGSWTPTINAATVVGTVNYTGRWTRVGRQVTVEILVEPQALSSLAFTAGTSYWTGFPAPYFPWPGAKCNATGPGNASFPSVGLVVVDDTPGLGKIVTLSGSANFLALSRTLFTATYTI